MRTAVRTAITTAVLAGAVLAPAGAAFAATPLNAAVTSASSSDPDPDRTSGTPVFIDKGVVAVLRFTSGPEARIRAVSPDWKPGDSYIGDALAVLDDKHRSGSAKGLKLALVKGETEKVETLVVTKDGKSQSYRLPIGQGSECRSEPVRKILGRGLEAILTTSPNGPSAELLRPASDEVWKTLDRANPALPEGESEIRILNANSAKPVLEWHVQNGAPVGHAAFPELPKGCSYHYTLQKPTEKPRPETPVSHEPSAKPTVAPSATPSATPSSTPAAPKQQTAGQTSVVPKGGVAAGAEIATQDTDDSTTALAGTGLAAILAGLGAFVLLRGRRTAQR
ncbi:hypothetical protein ACLF6K_18425 [Streptomyces xanthophaeus]|uniref:hypothetical protein n=1 Tax=Streptomyces xanthophaeus TaxID=67385 RepID=UPI00398FDB06